MIDLSKGLSFENQYQQKNASKNVKTRWFLCNFMHKESLTYDIISLLFWTNNPILIKLWYPIPHVTDTILLCIQLICKKSSLQIAKVVVDWLKQAMNLHLDSIDFQNSQTWLEISWGDGSFMNIDFFNTLWIKHENYWI